jgi:hypothetical protein
MVVQEILTFFGEISRQGKERVVQLSFSPDATLFGCLAADKTLELFRVHPADEVRHRQKKRVKRTLAKKKQQQGAPEGLQLARTHTRARTQHTAQHSTQP